MDKNIFLVIIGFGVLVVIFGIYFFFFSGREKREDSTLGTTTKITIEELLAVLKNQKSSKDDLQDASRALMTNFEIDQDTKENFLMFIYLLAKHKNSDSKIILELDKKIKAVNPEFLKESAKYQRMGLDERK